MINDEITIKRIENEPSAIHQHKMDENIEDITNETDKYILVILSFNFNLLIIKELIKCIINTIKKTSM